MRSYAPRVSQAVPPSRTPEGEVSFAAELASDRPQPRGERRGPGGRPPSNRTGLPDAMKENLERASGVDLSDLRVERNSPKPATLGASAYIQANRIYLAPGQEDRLPHEAWHAVQQRQRRVLPTLFTKFRRINDDPRLEREAEVLGRTAGVEGRTAGLPSVAARAATLPVPGAAGPPVVIQRSLEDIDSDTVDSPAGAIKKALKVPVKNLGLPAADRQPAFSQPRPRRVKAEIDYSTLRDDERKQDSSLSKVTSMARAEQYILEGYNPTAEYDAGHLVADQLVGGEDDSFELWNLAPQIAALNAPVYSNVLESEVRAAAEDDHTVELEVDVTYPANTYTVQLQDLVDRRIVPGTPGSPGTLVVNGKAFPASKAIPIPRRIPGRWRAKATILDGPVGQFPQVDKPAGRGRLAEKFAPDLSAARPLAGDPFFFTVGDAALAGDRLSLAESPQRVFTAVQRTPTPEVTREDVLSLLNQRFPNLSLPRILELLAPPPLPLPLPAVHAGPSLASPSAASAMHGAPAFSFAFAGPPPDPDVADIAIQPVASMPAPVLARAASASQPRSRASSHSVSLLSGAASPAGPAGPGPQLPPFFRSPSGFAPSSPAPVHLVPAFPAGQPAGPPFAAPRQRQLGRTFTAMTTVQTPNLVPPLPAAALPPAALPGAGAETQPKRRKPQGETAGPSNIEVEDDDNIDPEQR